MSKSRSPVSQIALYSEFAQLKAKSFKMAGTKKAIELKDEGVVLLKSPKFQTVTVSTAAGTVMLGGVGGAFGTASGVLVGGAIGVVPAIFTFGLSIPTAALIGGGVGLCAGTTGGGCAGALGGATGSYAVYSYRVEIKNGLIYIKGKANTTAESATMKLEDAKRQVQTCAIDTNRALMIRIATAKAKGSEAFVAAKTQSTLTKAKVVKIVSDPEFKKVSVATAGGALAVGTAGAATGTAIGGTIGALAGVVPAIFTFGLSIPLFAVIGGGAGFCTGTAVGSTIGAAGGAAGYKCYQKRAEINKSVKGSYSKVSDALSTVSSRAKEETSKMKGSMIKVAIGSKTLP